jgi:hypothetical protein
VRELQNEKLDKILTETGGTKSYTLIEFLDALDFQIAVSLKD